MPLPTLSAENLWWVIESVRRNGDGPFRVFHAVIGRDADEALKNLAESDVRLDEEMMQAAIRAGKIEDEWDWEPLSVLLEHRSVSCVRSQEDVSAIDGGLLGMLRNHAFFIDDFREDASCAVGGSVHPL